MRESVILEDGTRDETEYIVLADDTDISDAHILQLNMDSIIVYVKGGIGIDQMYEWFSNTENTAELTGNRYGAETVYTGFTELFALRLDNYDLSTACLRKPART